MKAALHRSHGGPDVIEVVEVPDPVVSAGDVLIEVKAAGLNRLDLLQRQGPPLVPGFQLPHIGGMDVAGEVVAVGDQVASVSVGDRVVVNPALTCGRCDRCVLGEDPYCPNGAVVGANRPGGFAERCAVPATHVHAIPDGFGFSEAAAVPTIYSTAWRALFGVGQLEAGETVLIHAAGSGVSTAAIQLAKRVGAKVIATSGTPGKLDVAAALGADVCLGNRDENWVQAVRSASNGGVDMVFDHVGPALFQGSLHALRPRGRLVFCGTTTGVEASFNLPHAYHFGLRLLGADSYSKQEFADMLEHYWSASYQSVIDSEFPLDQLAAAHEKLEFGVVTGKVIVRP